MEVSSGTCGSNSRGDYECSIQRPCTVVPIVVATCGRQESARICLSRTRRLSTDRHSSAGFAELATSQFSCYTDDQAILRPSNECGPILTPMTHLANPIRSAIGAGKSPEEGFEGSSFSAYIVQRIHARPMTPMLTHETVAIIVFLCRLAGNHLSQVRRALPLQPDRITGMTVDAEP